MTSNYIVIVYFIYGLAFFSMGLLVAIEGGRAPDVRLKKALRPMAGFGILHGIHEWLEMFHYIGVAGGVNEAIFDGVRLSILVISFVSLAAFGSYLLAVTTSSQRFILVVPLGLETIWVFGLLVLKGQFPANQMWDIADVWTRYSLAIPAAVLTAIGLVVQQRVFRASGLVRFGRDALWASVAFGWYGVIGQIFTNQTALPPSNVVNQELFFGFFGFPVQLMRALTATLAAFFVIRFLRAFQVETDRKIAELQDARLREAQERQAMQAELFSRVVAAQEAERQRIARDLHDETGQALTAIGLGLRGLSTSGSQSEKVVKTARQLEGLVTHSLQELQRLISDLRPSHLDDLGLPAAIRWYAGVVQERADLRIKVHIDGKEYPSGNAVKITLFRIVQEALTNIIKHASASNVDIHLLYSFDKLTVRIRDDGQGFNLSQESSERSRRRPFGLLGMQERATHLGGELTINSYVGKGTVIEVNIPRQQSEVEAADENSAPVGG